MGKKMIPNIFYRIYLVFNAASSFKFNFFDSY